MTYTPPKVGDVVHYWLPNPPPLSQDYVAPPCLPALIVSITEPDEAYEQYATLAIVTDEGLLVKPDVRHIESRAYTSVRGGKLSDPSYGVPASWHTFDHTTTPKEAS
ncbi:MAG TPA: hypothetical protein VGF17_24495 [Phytomonospora sp.]